jgi:WD40 repeat protein
VLAPGESLLLVVDQFEEVFRFRKAAEPAKDRSDGAERNRVIAEDAAQARQRERIRAGADAFVALLLEAVRRPTTSAGGAAGVDPPPSGRDGLPLYVILTMRSDFLGDCAVFPGLPERLNDSQFLTPRLSREQRREAIEGPAKVEGGQVEPALVNRLLNDMGAAPDQLPLMQHALMRLWLLAEQERLPGEGGEAAVPVVLKLADYEAMDGMAGALDRDATRAYESLDRESRRIAEMMFRLMSERGDGRLDTRRLARVGEVARVAEVAESAVLAVAERFRAPDLNLLGLSGDILDVSHESVIRNWKALSRWVEDEARAAEVYHELRRESRRFADDQRNQLEGDRLGPRMLELALRWRDGATSSAGWRPTAAWAERYGPVADFEQVLAFIRLNEDEARRERLRAERRKRLIKAFPFAALLVFIACLIWVARREILDYRHKAEEAEKGRRSQQEIAAQYKQSNQRYRAIQTYQQQLEAASVNDPLSALRVAQGLPTIPGLSEAESDPELHAYLIRRRSELQRQNALLASRTLAFAALNALSDGFPQRAVLLGVEAVRESEAIGGATAAGARDTLRQALRGLDGRPLIGRDAGRGPIAHTRAVLDMVAAPDGRWVATSSRDGTIIVWDPARPERSLRMAEVPALSGLALAPDGRWLVALSDGQPARLWNLGTATPFDRPAPAAITLEGYAPSVMYPTFSGDSRWLLLVGSSGGAMLWDLRPPAPGPVPRPHALQRPDEIWIASAWTISPDSRWLGLVRRDGRILLWALGAGGPEHRPIPNQHPPVRVPVRNAVFSENSRRLVATLIDGRIRLIPSVEHPHRPVRDVVLDGGEKGSPPPEEAKAEFERPPGHVRAAAGPPQGGGHAGSDGEPPLSASDYGRQVVATDYEGRWVLVQRQPSGIGAPHDSAGGYVLWDVGAAGRDAIPYSLTGVSGLADDQRIDVFSDRYLIIRGLDATVSAWDLTGPRPLVPKVFSGRGGSIRRVAFDAERRRLFTAGSDRTVSAWALGPDRAGADADTRPLTVLRGHDRPVAAMAIARDAEAPVLVTGGEDSEVRRWDLREFPSRVATEPQTLRGRSGWNTVILTPRGDWLAAATDWGPAQLRDLHRGRWATAPVELRGLEGRVTSFVTSPDGRWLLANVATEATAGREGGAAAWAWDLDAVDPTARPLKLGELAGRVVTLRASRDGRWLAMTTNADGQPRGLPTAAYLRRLDATGQDTPSIRLGDRALALEFCPDGRWLLVTDPTSIDVLPLPTQGPIGDQRHHLFLDADEGSPPRIGRDGTRVGAATRRGDVRLWQLDPRGAPRGRPRVIPGTGSIVREFLFEPAGRRVFVRDVLGAVRIWSLDGRPDGAAPDLDLSHLDTRGAAVSPDGRWFAWFGAEGGADRAVWLIDLSSEAAKPRTLSTRRHAAPGEDAAVQPSAPGLAFSRDSRRLVAVGDRGGLLWDLSRPDADPVVFDGQGSAIASVDVAYDRFLTLVWADNNVDVWDLEKPSPRRYPYTLRHDETTTATPVIDPDGQQAMTVVSGVENIARTWQLTADQLTAIAEQTVGRNLTPAERRQNLYWRTEGSPRFPALPTPLDESFAPDGWTTPLFGAPPGAKQTR